MRGIYLDYAASTPVDPLVRRAMEPYFSKIFGNPGAPHWFGQEASAAVFKARTAIAKAIGADYRDIVFTGSATEANNLALRGIIGALSVQRLAFSKNNSLYPKPYTLNPRIVVSAIEHESVLETARDLEKDGVEIVYTPVSREGVVDLKKLKAALNERTILVSVMYANNEVGTIQPIFEICKIIKDFKNRQVQSFYPLFHTDAVQAFQYLDCDVDKLGVDLMTLSAHKIYGPKGIGALYIKNYESRIMNQGSKRPIIQPLITGGGQEQGLRSGTENVPYIVGFAEAVRLAVKMREKEAKRVGALRDYFWRGMKKIYPAAKLNSPTQSLRGRSPRQSYRNVNVGLLHYVRNDGMYVAPRPVRKGLSNGARNDNNCVRNDNAMALPNILNVYFPGHDAADLLIKLDLAGVAASPGAACSSRAIKPSYVLEALGFSHARCVESLRFSLGRPTTKPELDQALDVMKRAVVH